MKFVDIIHFLNRYLKYVKIELATEIIPMRALYDPNSPHYRGTSINPSTGLPISGSVDASGRTYGAYEDHFRRSSSDDYHRTQIINTSTQNYHDYYRNTYTSSYDPFNRY